MAWLNRNKKEEDDLPPELKGKTPAEVAQALKDAADLKTKYDALEADRAKDKEAVTTMTSEFDKMKNKLAEIEANKNTPPPKPEELANFIEDPEKAFAQRVAPVANVALQGAAMTAKLLAMQQLNNEDMASNGKTMNGRLFQAWEGEILEVAKKYQTAQLTNPQSWLGIFYYVKGTHAEDLANPEVRKQKYNFLESSRSSSAPPPDNTLKPASDQLTDEEKRVADRMGVTHENYLKRKKAMKFAAA